MRGIRLALGLALAACVLSAPGKAQQQNGQAQPAQAQDPQNQGQPEQRPLFRTDVNFVRVDVIVTDKSGNPVADLKPEDFEVLEGGKAQKIETFKLVSLDGGLLSQIDKPTRAIRTDSDEESEAARDDVRLFGLFLDDYHVTRENSMSVRPTLSRFIQTQLGPSDMIAVMMPLDPVSRLRHTRNHDAVIRSVQQFTGRKYDYKPLNDQEARWMYQVSAETIERMRNDITMGALKAFITRMGGLKEGRKALIFVSEGFSQRLPPQMRDPVAGQPGFGNPFSDDPTAGDASASGAAGNAAFREQAFGGFDMAIYLREVYDLANRHNVAIYAVDPRGLAAVEFSIERNVGQGTDRQYLRAMIETLQVLAENSDGRAIINSNDLLPGMKQIVVDSSAYYLLGYTSSVGEPDGKFHEIDVKIKRRGLNVDVRHRRGYWALKPDEAARVNSPVKMIPPSPVQAAIDANVVPRNRAVRTWIGNARGENGKTRLTVVWEAMARAPGQTVRDAERPARLSVTVLAADGTALFKGAAPATPAPNLTGSSVSFDVPPGRMQLRLSTEGADAGVLDSEVREITVPDLTVPQVVTGTPEVFRARTVADAQRLKADPAAVPTATREFSRTERLLIRVPAYGPSASALKVAARLLNRTGQSMADVPVGPATGPQAPTIELGLSNLPPGDYGLEITVTGDGGESKQLIAFKVTS